MAHFTINLSNNQRGDVRCGTIKKMFLFPHLFSLNKRASKKRRGYLIKIGAATKTPRLYRLLKNSEGNWSSKSDGGFLDTPYDPVSGEIKKAIDDHENQQ